jgi:radical SAM superfamily enzyme YgiQ (UPF0313 family)
MNGRIALVSINAGRKDTTSHWPHYGLVLLATKLREAGNEARVFDQSFLRESDDAFVKRVCDFAPDVAGFSLYTTHATRGLAMAKRLLGQLPRARALCGGPHVSLYADEVRGTDLFAALVRNEAETVISPLIERLLRDEAPGIVDGGPTAGHEIPAADFRLAAGHERMKWLPIQLSRGCPFNCCFCEVKKIASRMIRYRELEVCLEEIERNLAALPHAYSLSIVDDCPTLDRARFKEFLRRYIERGLRARISIDNMRADSVDEELLDLLKQCRTPHVCVAAESGNAEVFRMVDKGESLGDVIRAATLVRAKGLPLYMCFIIGLPGSTFAAEMDSLRLARSLKADYLYWNMFLPHRGTRARDWFAEHGTIFEEHDRFSVPDYNLRFSPPAVETPEFPRDERVRAYLKCVLETVSFVITPATLARAFALAVRYGLWSSIPVMLARMPRKAWFYARLLAARMIESTRNRKAARRSGARAPQPREEGGEA